jgi:hypothetical protein
MMLGEFKSIAGDDYIMLVNLSLERSASFSLASRSPPDFLEEVSTADGTLRPFTAGKDGFWLTAGQGVLVRVRKGR